MNKRGFTLVELIATIAILGIVMSIAIFAANGGFSEAKNKTEDIFVKTLEDALNIYTDSDAKRLNFNTSSSVCTIEKRFGDSKVYKVTNSVTFNNVINSDYTPLTADEVVNPANEKVTCNLSAPVTIYRDDDYVYYYFFDKASFTCLTSDSYITNLPYDCLKQLSGLNFNKFPCGYMEQLLEDNKITSIPTRCNNEGATQ